MIKIAENKGLRQTYEDMKGELMANKCYTLLSISGHPDTLADFCFATILPVSHDPATFESFCFSFAALVPLQSGETPYDAWGCRNDVIDHITLHEMGWHPGCSTVTFLVETNNAPPIYWFYKVVAMYPSLEFDFSASMFMLDSYYYAHGSEGKITAEKMEQPS